MLALTDSTTHPPNHAVKHNTNKNTQNTTATSSATTCWSTARAAKSRSPTWGSRRASAASASSVRLECLVCDVAWRVFGWLLRTVMMTAAATTVFWNTHLRRHSLPHNKHPPPAHHKKTRHAGVHGARDLRRAVRREGRRVQLRHVHAGARDNGVPGAAALLCCFVLVCLGVRAANIDQSPPPS